MINNNSTYTLSTYTTYNSTYMNYYLYTLIYVYCGSLGPPQAEIFWVYEII